MQTHDRRGQLQIGDILPLALVIVVAGIGIAFGLNVLNDLRDQTLCDSGTTFNSTSQFCNPNNSTADGSSAAMNATKDTSTGVAKFSSKFSIIATVIVAAIVIGLLTRFLLPR